MLLEVVTIGVLFVIGVILCSAKATDGNLIKPDEGKQENSAPTASSLPPTNQVMPPMREEFPTISPIGVTLTEDTSDQTGFPQPLNMFVPKEAFNV